MYTVNLKRFDNTDKVTIWDYRRDDNIMKSGTLDKSVDQIDEFKFELINDSRQFESFLTLVEIKNELKNNIVFRGRILIPSQHMAEDGIFNSDYTVEGAAAYMHDSYPSYKFFESATPKSYITFLVNEHNKQVESYKQIKLGAVNFTMKEQVSEAVEYDTTKYAFTYLEKTVWQHIVDDCIGRWGGEILVRYEANGTYIDWLDPIGTKKDAALRIGKNIKSFSKSIDPTNVVTRLIPLGPSEESAAGQSQRLTIVEDSRSGGKNYIDIPELQKIYGIQNGIEIFEDEYTPDTLYNAAKRKVDDIKKNLVKQQMQINLLDLSYIGIDPDEYERGHQYEVFFEPFDVKEWVRIISTNEDITNPHNKSVVIGEKPLSIDDVQKSIAEQRTKLLQRKLDNFNQKLNDSISNVNTIVQDTLDTELQYYEKKIIKGDIPPTNTVNDVFWLDTSNPNVPILKRYWEGQWIKASVDNVEDIGGITREKALFSELSNTFINLTIQHSKLLNEMHEVVNSEYLVDEDIKTLLNSNLDKTVTVFNNIKTNLDSMTPDTATIGKLVDTQALFLKYREQLQALYKVVEQAKLSIDARFKLLQSQYTDEKFNKALSEVAEKFGLQVSEDNQLIGEPNVVQKAISVVTEQTDSKLANYVKSEDYQTDKNGIVERLDNSDSERQQLSNQIADRVTLTEYSGGIKNVKDYADSVVDGLEIGGRNLLTGSETWVKRGSNNIVKNGYELRLVPVGKTYWSFSFSNLNLTEGSVYTVSVPAYNDTEDIQTALFSLTRIGGGNTYFEVNPKEFKILTHTFTYNQQEGSNDAIYFLASANNQIWLGYPKLEKGNKATDWEPAIEDTDQKLTTMKTEIIQDGRKYSQEVSQQIYNTSSKTLNQTLSQYINSISTGHQFTYDENGNITNFTVGPSGIKLNAKVIDMNDGDVIIKDGVTTIKDAYIDKLFSNNMTLKNSLIIAGVNNGIEGRFNYTDSPDSYMPHRYSGEYRLNNQALWFKGNVWKDTGQFAGYDTAFFSHGSVKFRRYVNQSSYESGNASISTLDMNYQHLRFKRDGYPELKLENTGEATIPKIVSVRELINRERNIEVNVIHSNGGGDFTVGVDQQGGFVKSRATYARTTSGNANVYIGESGALYRSSSASKYKTDIKREAPENYKAILNLPSANWIDKNEEEHGMVKQRYFGHIAEDLIDIGLPQFVEYGENREVESIMYERLVSPLLEVVKDHERQIKALEDRLNESTTT